MRPAVRAIPTFGTFIVTEPEIDSKSKGPAIWIVLASPFDHTVGFVGMLGRRPMPDPMWKQIAEDLRRKIEAGDLGRDGKPLPTELELQAEYSASRNTVRDAIKWLVTRGLVYTRSGQGTFVARKIDPFVTRLSTEMAPSVAHDTTAGYASEVTSRLRMPHLSVPRIEIQRAEGTAATELRLPDDANVVSRHQQRFIDGVPYSLQTTFYPMSLVERGATRLIQADDITDGAVGYIKEAIGVEQVGWIQRIIVRAPDATETAFFSLPDVGPIAVFEITTTGYDKRGQPIRTTVTTYPADRNQFVMVSGKVPEEDAAFEAARQPARADASANLNSAGPKESKE
jgi:GntR family transcriptional regulator